ncbi:acyl carrier protein [Carboxylicivirga sp. A043]|uniref:phosphopantetheine-binding protein n=1 Tax=Carboxylicivirga litoralis TaxID=2816963 RepID=UPI0021CAF1DF|nr:phosphopantetheine-binding protein [Carboxylicivirga sp. A043]MCU4154371.1 acyl carrier protein [Carboxylicivirga sp. A043]
MSELKEELKKQLIEQLNLEDFEVSDIDDNDLLFGDNGLALDSIDALEIIVLLEKEYGIKIADPKQGKDIMTSVQTLADYIESKR